MSFVVVSIFTPLFSYAAPVVPCGIDAKSLQARNIPTSYQFGGQTYNYTDPCDKFIYLVIGVNNAINFLLEISGAIAAIIFAWAGILVLTAGDNEANVKKAKGMSWSVAKGFALMLAAWLLVKAVLAGLGIQPGFDLLQ